MKNVVIIAIKIYQATISPDHGLLRRKYGFCRHYPSCSQYAIDAITKYGVLRGTVKAGKRVLRCNPLVKPSFDPA